MTVPLRAPLIALCFALIMFIQSSTTAAKKLAFLTPPRHRHHPSSLPTLVHHNPNTISATARIIYSVPRLHNSRLNNAVKDDSSDDDDSICEVYQQVKEEDSEWYSKISQMLGNDGMELLDTTFTCSDNNDTTKAEVKQQPKSKVTEEVSKQDTNNKSGGDQSSNKDDANNGVAAVSTTKADASNESPQLNAPTKSDSPVEDTAEDFPKKQAVAGSHSEGHYTQFLDDENEEDMDVNTVDNRNIMETKSKVESSEAATKEDAQPTQTQVKDDREVESEQAPPPPSIVRIYNQFTNEYENIAPLSALQKLGYNEKELKLLRPQVLELIVDDRIPRPRRGIPKRWVKSIMNDDQYEDEEEERYDDDFGWQVQVVSRKKKKQKKIEESAERQNDDEQKVDIPKDDTDEAGDERMENKADAFPVTRHSSEDEDDSQVEDVSYRANSGKSIDNDISEGDNEVKQPRPRQRTQPSIEYEQEFRREGGYRPPPQRRRQPPQVRDDGYDDERPNSSRRPRRERGSSNRRQQRTPKRQELLIDRDSYGDDPSGNKFWMGLPMFKDFLRKEAQFRLKILGPDWKESVMDESRWRYDLYKTWLQMIDEGVGENLLYTYSDQPRQRRRRSRSQSDANYERERNVRSAPKRQVMRSQPDARQRRTMDGGDGFHDDYDYEEPSSKQKLNDVEEDQRRRTRQPEQRRTEQRPRRQTTRSSQTPRNERWTNFNDLEESLMKSKGEREPQGSREVHSRRRSDSFGDEIPSRRRRTFDIYEEEEESDEEEAPWPRYSTDAFDSQDQDEDIQPRRRRIRARGSSFEDEELQS